MENTENLQIPYIMPNQAQKHVTHNEAIRALDAMVQLAVKGTEENAPPTNPLPGSRYIIGPSPIDEWVNHANQIAAWQDGAWAYYTPQEGWLAVDAGSEKLLVFHNDQWTDPASNTQLQNMEMIGINALADLTNRLAVASSSSLFSHDGNDHRLNINKLAATDTASVVFQKDYSARAELGLTGSDAFTLKVSNDGIAWKDALLIEPANGHVGMPNHPTAKATLGSGWVDSPAGSATGFNGISINRGGFSLGETLPDGPGKYLLVPAAGYYHVTMRLFANAGSDFRMRLKSANSSSSLAFIETNESANKAFSQEASAIVELDEGEPLYFIYNQFARCFHAVAHTELLITKV